MRVRTTEGELVLKRGFIKQNDIKKKISTAAIAGLAAKRNGQSAEELMDATAAHLLQRGYAEFAKRYEPYRRVSSGSGSTFRGRYLGKSGADYEIWFSNGKAGHLEVKSREGARIEISAVDDFQAAQLDRRVSWGQLAFVLVRLSGEWFLVPWALWRCDASGESYSRKSHNLEQLKEIGLSLSEVGGTLSLHAAFESYFNLKPIG